MLEMVPLPTWTTRIWYWPKEVAAGITKLTKPLEPGTLLLLPVIVGGVNPSVGAG